MNRIDISNVEMNLLHLIQLSICSSSDVQLVHDNLNWSELYHEFRDQSLVAIPAPIISNLNMPQEVLSKWKHDILITFANNVRITSVQARTVRLLDEAGIVYVIIKGMSVSQYYHEPRYRTQGDIDILVLRDQYAKAKEYLRQAGYQVNDKSEDERNIHIVCNGVTIELHKQFSSSYDAKNDKKLELYINNGIDRSERHIEGDISFPVLPACENGIVILKHIQYHLSYGIGLRQVLDFIMYVDKVLDDNFWNEKFAKVASQHNVAYLAMVIAKIGQRYFGLSNSLLWCQNVDDDDCEKFLRYVLAKGNMGKKTNLESNTIVNNLNARGGSIAELIEFEKQAGLRHSSLVQKYRLLQPLAPIIGVIHHFKTARKFRVSTHEMTASFIRSRKQHKFLKKIGAGKGY